LNRCSRTGGLAECRLISEIDCADNKGGPKPRIDLAHNFLAESLALLRDYRDNEKSEMTEIRQFRTCATEGHKEHEDGK